MNIGLSYALQGQNRTTLFFADIRPTLRRENYRNTIHSKISILTHLAYIANGKKNVLYCATISLGE